jgi:hypothetical protein
MYKMAEIRRANRPAVDAEGYSTGVLTEVALGEGARFEKKGRDVEQINYDRYEFYFKVKGKTGDDIDIIVHTGTVINDEPVKVLGKARGKKNTVNIYNRFTSMCLALGLLTESELTNLSKEGLDDLQQKLEALENVETVFKVGRNDDGYFVIDIQSLRLA